MTFAYTESTNIVVATNGTSGTPLTFADFVTADLAGSAELLAAVACAFNMTLTYQIRPTMAIALALDFILASTSAGSLQTWAAASANITTGTLISGSVSDTATDNATYYQVEEVAGTPALDFDFTWSGLPTNYYPEHVTLNGYYDGNPAHDVFIYMWNYDTSAWDRLTAAAQDFPDDSSDQDYSFDVPSANPEDYFSSGAAKVRINHTSNGSAGHDFYVDQILLTRPATNNTLDITGTDWDDQAQTESIDVSAGDGTYNGAYKWRTITDIDCNGWADGTLQVTQPQWGVIWDYGLTQYRVDCILNIGNSSTSTYFQTKNEAISFGEDCYPYTTPNAYFYCGELDGDWGIRGSYISLSVTSHTDLTPNANTPNMFVYASKWHKRDANATLIQFKRGNVDIRNLEFSTGWSGSGHSGNQWIMQSTLLSLIMKDVYISTLGEFGLYKSGVTDDVHVHHAYFGYRFAAPSVATVADGVKATSIGGTFAYITSAASGVRAADLTNPLTIPTDSNIDIANAGPGENHYINWFVDVDIEVVDKDGADLSGVTILCEDVAAATAFSETTDVNGEISLTSTDGLHLERWKKEDGVSGGILVNDVYYPHKLTLSKAGYETLILENITVDSPIVWHLELQPIRARILGRPARRISAPNFQ